MKETENNNKHSDIDINTDNLSSGLFSTSSANNDVNNIANSIKQGVRSLLTPLVVGSATILNSSIYENNINSVVGSIGTDGNSIINTVSNKDEIIYKESIGIYDKQHDNISNITTYSDINNNITVKQQPTSKFVEDSYKVYKDNAINFVEQTKGAGDIVPTLNRVSKSNVGYHIVDSNINPSIGYKHKGQDLGNTNTINSSHRIGNDGISGGQVSQTNNQTSNISYANNYSNTNVTRDSLLVKRQFENNSYANVYGKSKLKTVNITDRDIEALSKLLVTEIGTPTKNSSWYSMAPPIIDTVLNRHSLKGQSILGVINAPQQFSGVTDKKHMHPSIRANGAGNVLSLDWKYVEKDIPKFVRDYIISRSKGLKSSIGGHTNFLNPVVSSQKSLRQWGNDVASKGLKVGNNKVGYHYHGTPTGMLPAGEYKVVYSGSGVKGGIGGIVGRVPSNIIGNISNIVRSDNTLNLLQKDLTAYKGDKHYRHTSIDKYNYKSTTYSILDNIVGELLESVFISVNSTVNSNSTNNILVNNIRNVRENIYNTNNTTNNISNTIVNNSIKHYVSKISNITDNKIVVNNNHDNITTLSTINSNVKHNVHNQYEYIIPSVKQYNTVKEHIDNNTFIVDTNTPQNTTTHTTTNKHKYNLPASTLINNPQTQDNLITSFTSTSSNIHTVNEMLYMRKYSDELLQIQKVKVL